MPEHDRRQRERQGKPACPSCGYFDSNVRGGYWSARAEGYVRKRKCRRCQQPFQTVETVKIRDCQDARRRRESPSI